MKKNFTITLLFLTLLTYSQNQADLDFYFSANTNGIFDFEVFSLNQQSNQKILVGTKSTATWNKTEYLKRLNLDGTLDNSFVPPDMIGSTLKILVQPDDKILLSTSSHLYGVGGNQKDFIRLNQDGTIDQQFQNNLNFLTGNGGFYGISLQDDGKILVAGNFTTVSNTNVNGLIRLNSNGLWDNSFQLQGTGIDGFYTQYRIATTSNGKILVGGGGITNYNGNSYNGLVRLNSDGSLDNTFNIGSGFENSSGASFKVKTLAVQNDGKILVGGSFDIFNGDNSKRKIVRLNQDGSIDNTFNPQLPSYQLSIDDIQVLSDNKIIVTGYISNFVLKLNADGSLDTNFNTGSGFNNPTRSSFEQTDGQILIGGTFTQYQGHSSTAIVRMLGNSVLSTEEFDKQKVKIFPNPVSDLINVEIDNSYKFKIYSMTGKLILRGNETPNKSINVNQLKKGIYILELETSNSNTYHQKFIKE
jgi:uncharacterized delta-60 repeat protein